MPATLTTLANYKSQRFESGQFKREQEAAQQKDASGYLPSSPPNDQLTKHVTQCEMNLILSVLSFPGLLPERDADDSGKMPPLMP